MPDKSGSNRIGFNRRGPSVKDQIDNARRLSAMNNPESRYWENRAKFTMDMLLSCVGEEEYKRLGEERFPGRSIDDFTWKEIHEAYDGMFQRVQAEIAMADFPNPENDPLHLKTNGVF